MEEFEDMNTVLFRPYQSGPDTQLLFDYMRNPATQRLFSHSFQIPTIQLFERWLSDRFQMTYHDFFMLEVQKKAVGFTFSYDFFPNDRHCKFSVCLFPAYISSGYGALAGVKMLNYLFSSYSLEQVFTSVFEYNKPSIALNLHAGFRQVGALHKYRYQNGKYWSLYYYVMDRDAFYSKARPLLERITRKDG
jgi:RimJ/RimL family protein N-acetyltransferase